MKTVILAFTLAVVTTSAMAQGWIQRVPQCRQVCGWGYENGRRAWICQQVCD